VSDPDRVPILLLPQLFPLVTLEHVSFGVGTAMVVNQGGVVQPLSDTENRSRADESRSRAPSDLHDRIPVEARSLERIPIILSASGPGKCLACQCAAGCKAPMATSRINPAAHLWLSIRCNDALLKEIQLSPPVARISNMADKS
jgi:hypothetical protein